MFCDHMAATPETEVTRLEWKYREDLWALRDGALGHHDQFINKE